MAGAPSLLNPNRLISASSLRQTVKPRFGIARLRQCRYGADLHKTEAKRSYGFDCDTVLVKTSRQADGIRKSKGTDPDLQPVSCTENSR